VQGSRGSVKWVQQSNKVKSYWQYTMCVITQTDTVAYKPTTNSSTTQANQGRAFIHCETILQ